LGRKDQHTFVIVSDAAAASVRAVKNHYYCVTAVATAAELLLPSCSAAALSCSGIAGLIRVVLIFSKPR